MPNFGIAVDRVSCPDTDIGVLTTRFPRVSCFEKPMRSVPETTTNTCFPQKAKGKSRKAVKEPRKAVEETHKAVEENQFTSEDNQILSKENWILG